MVRYVPERPRGPSKWWGELLVLAAVLACFAMAAIGPRIALPFVGDDYVFLDRTRAASFGALWSPTASVDFGWYRPWARETHFWVLQKIFGSDATAYRIVNVAVWVAVLCLYGSVLRRLATRKVAAIAALGVAALAFWGTPLLWISGSQDLWMLAFAMLALRLFIAGRSLLALPAFVLALLSKETAGVLPGLLCAYLLIVERRSVWQALRQTWAFWGVLMSWAILHPTLHARLLGGLGSTAELEHRPPWPLLVLKTVAACLNLDRVLHPQEVDHGVVTRVLVSGLLLVGGVGFAARRYGADASVSSQKTLALLALAWALMGWCPLLVPSIGWHAYYGCVGALGAWFGLALWLQSRPRLAMAGVMTLALLRGAQAQTISSDWGDEAYIQTAGSTLAAIRDDLLRQHPGLPPHSRVYVANIPYRVGLIAGNSPALRVWYADSTLEAGYYSYYRPRSGSEPPGKDYFFRFDTAAGMVEVKAGDEDVRRALASYPNWESDHDGLAALFMAKGDLRRAAVELEKLSTLRHRSDAGVGAAVCWRALGDSLRGDSLLRAAKARLQASDAQMQDLIVATETAVRRTARDP